ncbi:hypothetical protein [Actinoallomurus acaciae]|uniref:Transposase n=1 Tax=Actinoallomurus acaciae TaxID=502577 RepID=A0ABV5YGT5_9ACTN
MSDQAGEPINGRYRLVEAIRREASIKILRSAAREPGRGLNAAPP